VHEDLWAAATGESPGTRGLEPLARLGTSAMLPAGPYPEPLSSLVKNRLRELRGEREWSPGQLAERLNVFRETINSIETGKYDPSLPLAFAIARLFGRRIEDVFAPDR
jgi:putative transcriptional regulator